MLAWIQSLKKTLNDLPGTLESRHKKNWPLARRLCADCFFSDPFKNPVVFIQQYYGISSIKPY